MGIITALRVNDKRKQVSVFIDGSFSFTVVEEVAATAVLKVGQHLLEEQIIQLKQDSIFKTCLEAALHYLSYRPRSEAEVRQRLHRRGFNDEVVDEVIICLKERGLIDDVAFARYWKDNRLSFSPRSSRLIKLELRQKGVNIETANEAVEDLDDESAAYEAGLKKARVLYSLDYNEFNRRLSGYLRRRGFDHGTVRSAVEHLWEDKQIESV